MKKKYNYRFRTVQKGNSIFGFRNVKQKQE